MHVQFYKIDSGATLLGEPGFTRYQPFQVHTLEIDRLNEASVPAVLFRPRLLKLSEVDRRFFVRVPWSVRA